MTSFVVQNSDPVAVLTVDLLEQVKQLALSSPTGHARYCLHLDTRCAVQEMVIACRKDALFLPHRHLPGTSESYSVLEGQMTVYLFDDSGARKEAIALAPPGFGMASIYRLCDSLWHMPVFQTDMVVYHEVRQGPYERERDNEFPNWAPPLSDAVKVREFIMNLQVKA